MCLLHFYLSRSIISDQASFVIGSSDTQLLISAYVTKYLLWSAGVIWHSSLCFCNKLCVLDATFSFRDCIDVPDMLYQSFWSSSVLSIWDTCIRSCVLSRIALFQYLWFTGWNIIDQVTWGTCSFTTWPLQFVVCRSHWQRIARSSWKKKLRNYWHPFGLHSVCLLNILIRMESLCCTISAGV